MDIRNVASLLIVIASGSAHADSVRIFAGSPRNGTVNASGVTPGFYLADNTGGPTRHAIAEFNLSALQTSAGRVVVHSASLGVQVSAISSSGLDRLGFYAYEGNGVVDGSDFGAGDLLTVYGHSAQTTGYNLVDIGAWLQGALDQGVEWAGINIRQEGGALAIVNFWPDNVVLPNGQVLEYAPRLLVNYSIEAFPVAIPLPGAGALSLAGLGLVAARRRR